MSIESSQRHGSAVNPHVYFLQLILVFAQVLLIWFDRDLVS